MGHSTERVIIVSHVSIAGAHPLPGDRSYDIYFMHPSDGGQGYAVINKKFYCHYNRALYGEQNIHLGELVVLKPSKIKDKFIKLWEMEDK